MSETERDELVRAIEMGQLDEHELTAEQIALLEGE